MDRRKEDIFYIDKTMFIKEWWENYDSVTLITRPRRFGKTLLMSMVEEFFRYSMRAGMIYSKGCVYGKRRHTAGCRGHILSSAFLLLMLRSRTICLLSRGSARYYGKKVIILLDEYDTPMQEAYVNGYWEELAVFMRSLFNAAFKTNPYLARAIMTGITRVGSFQRIRGIWSCGSKTEC